MPASAARSPRCTARARGLLLLGAALVSCVALGLVLGAASAAGAGRAKAPAPAWTWPNADRGSTRAAAGSSIASATVRRLRVAWRVRMRGEGGYFGLLSTTPLVRDGVAYVQDTRSSVFALDLRTGKELWSRVYAAPNDGPNGITLAGDRLVGATDTTAFALDISTGRQLWATRLVSAIEQFVNIAPVVDRGRVYLSTVGFPPGGRGALYGLDLRTGKRLWKFDTIAEPWRNPTAGGGGAWQPLSVDGAGRVYAGIANPGPWGGSKTQPNGGWFRGQTLYTDSLVVLDGATGRLAWFDQVLKHDVRDYDFHLSPILATVKGRPLVIGGGKAARIHAWDRTTGRRVWSRAVGTHRNDVGPLPVTPVEVCPGLFGGALTPMAYAAGRVFVPVVELCMKESAVKSFSVLQRPPEEGTGVVAALDAATGRQLWERRLPSALFGCATVAGDLVVAPTYDGWIYALSARTGAVVWKDRARAGINGCPSVAGDTLLVPAGAPHRDFAKPVPELIAYRLTAP